MTREAPVRAHQPKQPAASGSVRAPPPAQAVRCTGAAAQLAAVHRTLRHGPAFQLQAGRAESAASPHAAAANRTGLPDRLKSGVEALSGVSLDGVRVHYNSSKPAQLNALAYAQGSAIHVAPGQERHLPHEAWHVVQQAQGRVKPTLQMMDATPINDDSSLEREADVMGARALANSDAMGFATPLQRKAGSPAVAQLNGKGSKTTPSPDADALFKNLYSSASADPAADSVGAGGAGAGGSFITVNPPSTHHIFPKSQLIPTAITLSKWQSAAHAAKKAVDDDKERKVRQMLPETSQRLSALASMVTGRMRQIGIDDTGTWVTLTKTDDYYWLKGNLFVGVESGSRTDDPGSKEEAICPQSFPADLFSAAKAWGKYTVALKSKLDANGTGFSYNKSYSLIEELLDTFLEMRKVLKGKSFHYTSEKIGQDWVLTGSPTARQYAVDWGLSGHRYMVNKSAGNKFEALNSYVETTAESIALSVRKIIPTDMFDRIRAPLRGNLVIFGPLRKEYFSASDVSETNPKVVYAGLDKLVPLLEEVLNNPAFWSLVPNLDKPHCTGNIPKLRILRDRLKPQYADIISKSKK